MEHLLIFSIPFFILKYIYFYQSTLYILSFLLIFRVSHIYIYTITHLFPHSLTPSLLFQDILKSKVRPSPLQHDPTSHKVFWTPFIFNINLRAYLLPSPIFKQGYWKSSGYHLITTILPPPPNHSFPPEPLLLTRHRGLAKLQGLSCI